MLKGKNIDFSYSKDKTFIKNLNIEYIISDISPIGALLGNKLQLPVILITNFTWVEQYEYIGIDESIINI